MKRIIALTAALAAAVCLCGCELNKNAESSKNSKTADNKAEDTYVPVKYSFSDELKEESWTTGGPLTYSDFVLDEDYVWQSAVKYENTFNYVFWYGKNDEDELTKVGKATSRLWRTAEKEEVLKAYGETEVHETDIDSDRFYHCLMNDEFDRGMELIEESPEYVEYYYKIPGKEGPFENYMVQRFYFDEDGNTNVFAIIYNEDIMMYDVMHRAGLILANEDTPFDPDGMEFRPALLLMGVMDGEAPRTDKPLPIYTFRDGVIKSEWYDIEGNKAEEHPASVFDSGVKYSYEDGDIVLALNGYSDEEVYIVYDRHLKAYVLHEPCWREQGRFVMLSQLKG